MMSPWIPKKIGKSKKKKEAFHNLGLSKRYYSKAAYRIDFKRFYKTN